MIYLSEKDILAAVDIADVLDCVEQAMLLYETKDFLMPQRMHVEHNEDVLLVMPCFTKDSFATKLVTLFPENPKMNVPVLNGIVVLNDVKTGVPLALLNGPVLTALRTGAVGGVSIRHLAPEDTTSFGIIGAGAQGFYQARLATAARDLTDIYVFDLDTSRSRALIDRLSAVVPNINLHTATSVEELLENCQSITTATTATKPVLPENPELLQGKHFAAIGSYQPHVRELPSSLYSLIETVYIDTEHALEESGDIIVPLENGWITTDQVKTLGGYLTEKKNHEIPRDETTLFKSVGMALFDATVSKLVYDNAIKKQLGQQIDP
jgi:ornithine cyclodeaminase